MRDGISVLAELVDRIESGEVRVENASLRRAEGSGLDVDLSVHIPDDAGTDTRARGATAGEETASTPDATAGEPEDSSGASGATTPADPPAFGARSVSIGASLGGDHALARNEGADAPGDEAGADAPGGEADADAPGDAAGEGTSDDEPVECRVEGCEETFATEHGMKIHATKAHRGADGSGPSPHRDPERLREVYETHETFDEMTAALDVDVTAQTVRRSMMSLGIHDPDGTAAGGAPAETSTDEEADDGPPVEAVLPPDVDAGVLVTAVQDASTLFQVQRAMGVEREEAQTLLAELDLLDLVTGRVATEDERDASREEIERRIVEAAAGGSAGDGADEGVDERADPPVGAE